MYFTGEHLRIALQRLPDSTHPALVTFLTMLRSEVPMSDSASLVPYGAEQENPLLRDYFSPHGGTDARPFYVPFGPHVQGQSRWKTNDYSGSSLQRMRTGSHAAEIYRTAKNDQGRVIGFALRETMPAKLADQKISRRIIGSTPLSAHLLAVWLYRQQDIASHAAAIARFATEFRLSERSLIGSIFSITEDPQLTLAPLSATPITNEEITEILEPHEGSRTAEAASAEDSESAQALGTVVGTGSWEISQSSLDQAVSDLLGVRTAAMQALAALRAGMHVVFTGPPGSGKTELAKRVCKAAGFTPWIVTATDSWSTFETIGGYFPQFEGKEERLDFEPGVITASMQQGKIIIIDEINRADIDKAFGELFTLLAGSDVDLPYRRRARETTEHKRIRLVNGDRSFPDDVEGISAPSWWRIIGAMNDADKTSLKKLSFAFVRRFAFIPVTLPTPTEYSQLIDQVGSAAGLSANHRGLLDALKSIFSHPNGLSKFGMAMGFAIPKAMVSQIVSELGIEQARTDQQLLSSAMCLYLAPQFQGWADKHEEMINLAKSHLGGEHLQQFESSLMVWTGYVP